MMNNSEMRGAVRKWVNEFEEMFECEVPLSEKFCDYLSSRIEENLTIENDPDVVMVRKDNKLQPARVISENRANSTVTVQLLSDRTFMMLTYDMLKKMSSGAEVASALNIAAGIPNSLPSF